MRRLDHSHLDRFTRRRRRDPTISFLCEKPHGNDCNADPSLASSQRAARARLHAALPDANGSEPLRGRICIAAARAIRLQPVCWHYGGCLWLDADQRWPGGWLCGRPSVMRFISLFSVVNTIITAVAVCYVYQHGSTLAVYLCLCAAAIVTGMNTGSYFVSLEAIFGDSTAGQRRAFSRSRTSPRLARLLAC